MQENICGWKVRINEKIRYRASTGDVRITLKVPAVLEHMQIAHITKKPPGFKIIKKGLNSFLVFRGKVGRRGLLDLSRELEVYPVPRYVDEGMDWGRIEDIEPSQYRKYMESSYYWPLHSEAIGEVREEEWFSSGDIKEWIHGAVRYLWHRIENPEPQGTRLGAETALSSGRGDCDEFTDLLISFARLRGIPARRVTGMYISGNVELHAWSELYFPMGEWVVVDAAMRNIGNYTPRYVGIKMEEFNSAIPDYSLSWKGGTLKYEVERDEPWVQSIPC